MNILAIETATNACAVGVRRADLFEVTRVVNEDRRHTEVLTESMRSLLGECGLVARDVDRVVVDQGPGLFTGLRVGVATAVAFAQALGCDVVAVTSLELLARAAFDAGVRGVLVGCVDGRRGELFVQSFELGTCVEPITQPEVRLAKTALEQWAESGVALTFTGDGVQRYDAGFREITHATIFPQSVPSVHAALELAAQRSPADTLTPMYLRDADAVANFTTRERHH